MAGALISIEDAAKILGVSTSELNEMRLRQEIYGYRDGASWKFKPDEVERVKQERDSGASASDSYVFGLAGDDDEEEKIVTGDSDDSLPLDLSPSGSDVVLLSEDELGDSALASANTVIGGEKPGAAPSSDILSGSSAKLDMGSDLRLVESDIGLVQSDVKLADSGPSDTGDSRVLSGSELGSPDSATILTSEAPSNLGSSIKLSMDDDDVLGGSGTGSDITINPGDSGISLVDPSDSGLSLEEPLELRGRADDLLSMDSDLALDQGEDDFLLTPLEDVTDEESDSGSQVIALDAEGEFEDATATLLGSQVPGLHSMLEEDASEEHDPLAMPVGGPAMAVAGAGAGGAAVTQYIRSETKFGMVDVLLLSFCLIGLTLSGMMMLDLVRNMWSWDSPYSLNSWLMDMLAGK